MMANIPADKDISWHKSPEFFKATLKFHEEKARRPESLKAAKAMNTAMILEINRDFQNKGISQRPEFTGSAYEGVKVAKCEGNDDLEFDVMLVLEVPKSGKLQYDNLHGKAGFSFIRYSESRQVPSCWFTENCLSIDEDEEDCLDEGERFVDASRTVNKFFGELQKWINGSPKYKDQILLRRHGPAVQMDVYKEKVTSDPPYYSVDVVPAIEIPVLFPTQLYVAKPLKNKGMPDTVTWRQLDSRDIVFRKRYTDTRVDDYTMSHLRCMDEFTGLLRTKYQFDLIGHEIDTDNGNDLEYKVLVVNKSHSSELQLDQVPEKPEFYWIVPKKNQPTSMRLDKSLKTCYRPCGMHLDSRRATTAFVEDLQDCIKKSTLLNGKVHIRRDGPVVRLLICEVLAIKVCGVLESSKKSSSIPTPLYYVDLIFAHKINDELYTARPIEEKNVRDAKAWRMSFSVEEKKELYGKHGCLKKVFRVCKVLRNAEVGLAQLTSYHLKTILFSLKRNCDWSDTCIGERLMNVIGKLERCLEDRKLQHFFLKELNLTSGMINDCMKHMQNRLFRLYFSKRHMLKVLGVPWDNVGITQAVKVIDEKVSPTFHVESQSRDLSSNLSSEIDKLFDNFNFRPTLDGDYFVYDYTVVRTDDNDDVEFYAMVVITDQGNELQTLATHCASFEARPNRYKLAGRKMVMLDHNLRRNMSNNFLDATKTANFIADILTNRIASIAQLRGRIYACAEGTIVKIRSSQSFTNFPDLIVIPACKTEDKLFVAADGKDDSLAWRRSNFLEEHRKIRQVDCGLRVLRILKFLRRQEPGLNGLTTRHIRAALLWELHDEPDWAMSKMAERLLDVMDRLYFAVTVNCLEDYFSSDVNVLLDVNQRSLPDLRRYLSKFCENEDEQVRILKSKAFPGELSMRQLHYQYC